MIVGVGIDVLELERVQGLLRQQHGQRFVERVLTAAERDLAAQRTGRLAEFVAGRFCAKEAIVKAIGCGIGKQVGFQDIEVVPDRMGKPIATLSAAAWERLGYSEPLQLHLSITHSGQMAAAYAVAEQRVQQEARTDGA